MKIHGNGSMRLRRFFLLGALCLMLSMVGDLWLPGAQVSGVETVYAASFAKTVPQLVSAKAGTAKITVTWESVKGATSYYIYRKNGDGSYKKIGSSTGTSYSDTTPLPGITYTYTVRGIKKSSGSTVKTSCDKAGLSAMVKISAVELKSASMSGENIAVKWTALSNVDGYLIYRKVGEGSYAAAATITDGTTASWKDSDVVPGETYTYTVRAYVYDGDLMVRGPYYSAGISILAAPPVPEMTGAVTFSGRNLVTWNSVQGATGYYVYRKVEGGSYKKIAAVKDVTFYKDSSAVAGTTYIYAVRSYVKVDGVTAKSKYQSLTVVTKPEAAQMTSLSTNAKKTKDTITWSAVSDIDGYNIYKKNAETGGKWSLVTAVGSTVQTYTLKRYADGVTSYAVRPFVTVDGKKVLSAVYDSLSNEEQSYQGTTILFDGDSITKGYTWSGDTAEVSFPIRVAQLTGCTIVNQAETGATLAQRTSETSSLWQRIVGAYGESETAGAWKSSGKSSILEEADSFDSEQFLEDYGMYDVICIAAGTNDWNDRVPIGKITDFRSDTFYGAWNEIFDRLLFLKQENPDLKIVLITPLYRGRYGSDMTMVGMDVENGRGYTLQEFVNAIYDIRDQYQEDLDIYVYDSVEAGIVTQDNYLTTLYDSLHPTRETYLKIGASVADFLKSYVLTADSY